MCKTIKWPLFGQGKDWVLIIDIWGTSTINRLQWPMKVIEIFRKLHFLILKHLFYSSFNSLNPPPPQIKGRSSTSTSTQWLPPFWGPPMKVLPSLCPTFRANTSLFNVPRLNNLAFLVISLWILTTTLGHSSMVSFCMSFSCFKTHVTWSVETQPCVPDAARRASSSAVRPVN